MLKKLIAATITFFALSPAFATVYVGPSVSLVDNMSLNRTYRNINPMLHVGYDSMISPTLYLAAELSGALTNYELEDENLDRNSLRTSRMLGISIIPGITLTETVIAYLRIGMLRTLFTAPNIFRLGLQTGIGLQTPLTDYWHLRAEYDYTSYRSENTIGAVKADQFMVSFIYHFM